MPRSSSHPFLPTGSRLLAQRCQDLHHRSRVNLHRSTLAHRRVKCLPQRNTQLYLRNLLAQFRHSFVNSLRTLP
ncbi:MAG: hypothetical protein HC924_18795 [Synechococcaceae cyanobacterium SM2_3_2]|nr:hypothetical protein [Synechococcaceae cyanobacterium SM2_3_2]